MPERTVAAEATLALTGAEGEARRPAPRPGESTLALSGSYEVLGRPGSHEVLTRPVPSDMPSRKAGSPEESTQVVTNLAEQVQAAGRGAAQPRPPTEASWLSPRVLIILNVVLGALILGAVVVLLLR